MFNKVNKALISIFIAGTLFGILFWGGLHTVIEATNSVGFCTGCHEMDQVYQEYKKSIHYSNAAGVRAICSDCHVPKNWLPKMIRKFKATNELYHKVVGSIDTPEKFEAKRLEMAENVWESMKSTDSRECRNCHSFGAMNFHKQQRRSAEKMQKAIENKTGETCIDCHKGIAHKLPAGYGDDEEDD